MLRETVLIIVCLLSVLLVIKSYFELDRLKMKGIPRIFLTYLILLVPLLGFVVVHQLKRKTVK